MCAERRLRLKIKCVEYLGGKCQCCGYNKCYDVFDFHHRDPKEKKFQISNALNARSGLSSRWEILRRELDKCDLLCANCHRELHSEQNSKKPKNTARKRNASYYSPRGYTGSAEFKWPEISWLTKEIQQSSFVAVAEKLGVSHNGIRKFLKKNGIDPKTIRSIKDNRFL